MSDFHYHNRKCPITGCSRALLKNKLMCPTHWYMVPNGLKAAVYRGYRLQPLGKRHLAAMRAAIEAVENWQHHG